MITEYITRGIGYLGIGSGLWVMISFLGHADVNADLIKRSKTNGFFLQGNQNSPAANEWFCKVLNSRA
jgi:hypothetical protein